MTQARHSRTLWTACWHLPPGFPWTVAIDVFKNLARATAEPIPADWQELLIDLRGLTCHERNRLAVPIDDTQHRDRERGRLWRR